VIALAGKTARPVSFSNLLGKSGHCSVSGVTQEVVGSDPMEFYVSFPSVPFFDSAFSQISEINGGVSIVSSSAPHFYTGNIVVTNATLGIALVCNYVGSGTWQNNSGSGIGLGGHVGQTYNFTINPHT
jgi:hypothetical protein